MTFVLVAMLTLVGCKDKKDKGLRYGTPASQITNVAEPDTVKVDSLVSNVHTASVVKEALATEANYKVLNISKMETRLFYGGKQLSLNCGVKIFKDQLIEISIRPIMGVEIFRVHFTPQKFAIFDKFKKTYCESTYDYFRYEYAMPIAYEDIQALFTGRLFTLDPNVTGMDMKNSFVAQSTDSTHTLIAKNKVDKMVHRFELGSDYRIKKTALAGNKTDILGVTYDDYSKIGSVIFPHVIRLVYAHGTQPTTIDFSIQKAVINDKSQPTAIDYSRYTKQNCSKILP